MRANRKDFDETKYISSLIKMMNYQKSIMKFEEKLKLVPKKNLIAKMNCV